MSLNKVSCMVVISKLATQFKLSETGWHGEAIEYIGEAIRLIGYHTGYEKVRNYQLQVVNHKAKIPCNFESIETVWYNCCPMLLAYDKDRFHARETKFDLKNSHVATYEDIIDYNKTVDRIEELKKQILEEKERDPLNTDLSKIQTLNEALNAYYHQLQGIGRTSCIGDNYRCYKGRWYTIENGYIKTDFSAGTIYIDGNAIALDDNDYPMVADTGKYLAALEWYVRYQMLLSGYTIKDMNWMQAFQMWEDMRQRAANEPKIMGPDELERFTNRWTSIKRTKELTYQS